MTLTSFVKMCDKMLQFFRNRRGASAVVGTVIMVGVVFILVLTIGVFALSLGDSIQSSPPVASLSAEQVEKEVFANGGSEAYFYALEITHLGCDSIPNGQLSVQINGKQAWGVVNDSEAAGYWVGDRNYAHRPSPLLVENGSSFRTGQSITVVHKDNSEITINEGDSYRDTYSIVNENGNSGPEISELYKTGTYNGGLGPTLQLDVGDRVTVVWQSKSGDQTVLLLEEEIRSLS